MLNAPGDHALTLRARGMQIEVQAPAKLFAVLNTQFIATMFHTVCGKPILR